MTFSSLPPTNKRMGYDSEERIKPAIHGWNVGDLVGLKKGVDVWFLGGNAIGRITGFMTEGHSVEVEWRDTDYTDFSKKHKLHNFLSADLLELIRQ